MTWTLECVTTTSVTNIIEICVTSLPYEVREKTIAANERAQLSPRRRYTLMLMQIHNSKGAQIIHSLVILCPPKCAQTYIFKTKYGYDLKTWGVIIQFLVNIRQDIKDTKWVRLQNMLDDQPKIFIHFTKSKVSHNIKI